MQKGKRGAIEMSMSTIVILVLAVSLLILGVGFINKIRGTTTSVLDITDQQLKDQISKLFGEDKKVVVYPDSKIVSIKQGEAGGFGIGIKNLREGSSNNVVFSYEVVVSDLKVQEKCGVSAEEIEKFMVTGQSETDIPLASGEIYSTKVIFETQVGDPLCTVRMRVNAKANNEPYGSPQAMDVTFKAA